MAANQDTDRKTQDGIGETLLARILGGVLLLGFASIGWHYASLADANGSPSCGPPSARTLAESSYVRVYQRRSRERQPMIACSKRTKDRFFLDDPESDETAFPSVAVNRWYVAYANNTTDPDYVYTTVGLLDSRKFGRGGTEPIVGGSYADERITSKVGSIVVNPRGGFAWIACESGATYATSDGCDRPGVSARVWRISSPGTGDAKQLDNGKRIDPSSLRLRGTRIRWLNGRERKKAKLE